MDKIRLRKTLKKWLSNIGAMLLSTLVMLIVAELIIRFFVPQKLAPVKFVYDKDIGLIHVPHMKGSESYPGVYDIEFSNGADGFRTSYKGTVPDFINKKIMLIGDSFTYGAGVNDEETFAYQLQEMLLEDSVQIINAGAEGRGTDRALRAYQHYKDKYQPNTVIFFAHYNDIADNIREEYFEVVNDSTLNAKSFEHLTGGKKVWLQESRLYNWLISNSHFFALLKKVLVANFMGGQAISYDEEFDKDRAKQLTSIFFQKLKNEIEADGRKFIVYYIPSTEDIEARLKGEMTDQEQFFEKTLEEKNITFHNLSEDFIDSGEIKTDANGFY